MTIAILAAAFVLIATLLHLASIAVAMVRCNSNAEPLKAAPGAPAVSVVIPICGLENFIAQTLGSAFRLDYPNFEIIFCVARRDDAAIALVQSLIAAHPKFKAQLLIGDERITLNPKLNNLCKGWTAARYDWVVIPDSNVLMPRDYLQRLLASWRQNTGLVCSPPTGCHPQNFWAELECAFLNGYQARWQYFADSMGHGFAQGKTMLWRKSELNAAGGLPALGIDAAEDAAATKVVRATGLNVRLVSPPARQPLGLRNLAEIWKRQRRWSRLRRASFPLYFAAELASGAVLPMAVTALACGFHGWSPALGVGALASLWYGAEMALTWHVGWPLRGSFLACAILRDLMIPVLWCQAWGDGFEWRGTPMSVTENVQAS